MNCIHCKGFFEPKAKFCSSKCRISHFREDKCNAIVTEKDNNVTQSLQKGENIPDWAKDIMQPKEPEIIEKDEYKDEYEIVEEL